MIVAIASAALWEPARRRTLDRLLAELDPIVKRRGWFVEVAASPQREEAAGYGFRRIAMVRALYYSGRTDVVFLDDDVLLAPGFAASLTAALAEVPERSILGLHITHPRALALAGEGHRFVRTPHVTGPAYVIRAQAFERVSELYDHGELYSESERRGDDTRIMRLAPLLSIPVYATLPALVSHDASVPSTFGYDWHPERAASVPWSAEWAERPWRSLKDHPGIGTEAVSSFLPPAFDPPFLPCSWWNP
jgi:hypothetical protein